MTANLGFACLDIDRERRRGMPEAIFGQGKTPDQIVKIIEHLNQAGQNALATRIDPQTAELILKKLPDAVYHADARAITHDVKPLPVEVGGVAVVCAGTTDINVAAEATLTARRLGAKVEQINDIGVAGLHRLLGKVEILRQALVVIVVAGMEGALPSVVGGLVDRPIIAVPTSVGYGASFQGLSALLAMLNSCAPGITVVNIDNGFGAGIAAAAINRQSAPNL